MYKLIVLSFFAVLFSSCIHFEDENSYETEYAGIQNSVVAQNIKADLESGLDFWDIYETKYHPSYFIGVEYAGGIIFQTSSTSRKVYIANGGFIKDYFPQMRYANNSSETVITFPWPNDNYLCSDSVRSTSSALGEGEVNTAAILSDCDEEWSFAEYANDVVFSGQNYIGEEEVIDDWFLPSFEEVNTISNQFSLIYFDSYPSINATIPTSTYEQWQNANQNFSVIQVNGFGGAASYQEDITHFIQEYGVNEVYVNVEDVIFVRTESEN